jgi:HAD superfamily hydrolase (TIGR01509 family)
MTEIDTVQDKYQKLLSITDKGFDAFLYDCDGTLADNMQAHKDAYVKIAREYGIKLDDSIIDELAGWPTVDVAKEISARYNVPFDPKEFAEAKSEIFYQEYIDHTKPIEFVANHLLNHAGKVKIAVVSGGRRKTVQRTLKTLGLWDKVEVFVGAGDTPNGKPSPEPFLLAAQQLGVEPAKCLVFEDGDPGVQGAIAAGMHWVRIDQI